MGQNIQLQNQQTKSYFYDAAESAAEGLQQNIMKLRTDMQNSEAKAAKMQQMMNKNPGRFANNKITVGRYGKLGGTTDMFNRDIAAKKEDFNDLSQTGKSNSTAERIDTTDDFVRKIMATREATKLSTKEQNAKNAMADRMTSLAKAESIRFGKINWCDPDQDPK